MKIENSRALAAEKKTYEIPSVESTLMTLSSFLMASPIPPLPIDQTPIPGGGD